MQPKRVEPCRRIAPEPGRDQAWLRSRLGPAGDLEIADLLIARNVLAGGDQPVLAAAAAERAAFAPSGRAIVTLRGACPFSY